MKQIFYKAKEYLTFSKSEQKGIMVLLGLIVLIIAVPFVYRKIYPYKSYDYTGLKKEIVDFETRNIKESITEKKLPKDNPIFFKFDPNTSSSDELRKLGFSPISIKSILNYRLKKGKFRENEDLKKMFGMSTDFYKKIEPFIDIKSAKKDEFSDKKKFSTEKKKTRIEINSADSAKLVSVWGIGPVYAKRIMKYRDKLGGFYSLNQIKEVYGLPDSLSICLMNEFVIDTGRIKHIQINSITEKDLSSHPYVSVYQAKGVLNYRKLQGNFKNEQEFRKSKLFPDTLISRILPYIAF
jgi:competence protein ComEA